MPKYGRGGISASGVSLKWVKSNRGRKREIERKKISDYNGQYLSPEPKKAGENNGQLRLCPPPRVAHASRLDQKKVRVKISVNNGQVNRLDHNKAAQP